MSNRPRVVGGWTEGNRGGEITPSARGTALIALQILQPSRFTISFALASLPPSEKLFPSLHLEYFFSFSHKSSYFLVWEARANDHPFYRNLFHIRKCVACTQAYISKYNSFSIPSPASFDHLPPLHLQTCHRAHSPPALHCPAPLGAAGRDYQPCLTHRASVRMTQTEMGVFSSSLRMVLVCLGPTIRCHPGCFPLSSSSCSL